MPVHARRQPTWAANPGLILTPDPNPNPQPPGRLGEASVGDASPSSSRPLPVVWERVRDTASLRAVLFPAAPARCPCSCLAGPFAAAAAAAARSGSGAAVGGSAGSALACNGRGRGGGGVAPRSSRYLGGE